MAEHPDLADVKRAHDMQELRERYERAAETPTGQAVEGLIVLSGLYLAMSSWIAGFAGPLQVNNLVLGLAVAVLGLGFAAEFGRTHRLAWVMPILGVWAIVSLWAVSGADATLGAILGNIIAGAIVLLCGLAILAMGTGRMERMRLPGGS